LPLKDSVVYLKNRKNNKIVTIIADSEGAFRFPNLSRTDDYELYAELKGQKSSSRALSAFDTRTNAKINLHIEIKKDEKQEAKKEVQATKPDEKKPPENKTEDKKPDQ